MPHEKDSALIHRIAEVSGRTVKPPVTILEDTSDYFRVDSGSVLRLEGNDYFIAGDAREGRFGIGDQPKHWVKYGFDLDDGSRKIIKLVFHEQFTAKLGPFTARCIRNPDKESRVLELVGGDLRFMQGQTLHDTRGNNVRVIEQIRGRTLFNHIALIKQSYETYVRETLPPTLWRIMGCLEALERLHRNGLHHGDVRNDHIIIERETGEYRWIDFDYEVNFLDYDLWSAGNILAYAAGKGIRSFREFNGKEKPKNEIVLTLTDEDGLLFFPYRIANLRKVFPFLPEQLNAILMRFSIGTTEFYESLDEVIDDLRRFLVSTGYQDPRTSSSSSDSR